MAEIILVDESDCGVAGHNKLYRDAVSRIDGTKVYENVCAFPSIVSQPIQGHKIRKKYFSQIPSGDIACLLHMDTVYMVPFIIRSMRKKYKAIVGVLHWFPKGRMRQFICKITAKYIDKIVVHSDYIKKQLQEIGIENVCTIDYPVFRNVDLSKLTPKQFSEKRNFLCIGGSRFDKGYDILAECFQYIKPEFRNRIRIVIAGEEIDIPYKMIENKARDNGIEVVSHNARLSEEEYWQYVQDTDVILLPYRRMFSGNSGPMTDGVSLDKFILGPDEGNLGYLINKYQLGCTFKIESPVDLALKIEEVSQMNITKKHKYREKLSVESFVDAYEKLFNSIILTE